MSDKAISNLDYLPENEPSTDLSQYMKSLFDGIKKSIDESNKRDKERMSSLDWEWTAIHICNSEIARLMQDDNTPSDIKHRLAAATYAGHQWVWVGEGPEPINEY